MCWGLLLGHGPSLNEPGLTAVHASVVINEGVVGTG